MPPTSSQSVEFAAPPCVEYPAGRTRVFWPFAIGLLGLTAIWSAIAWAAMP